MNGQELGAFLGETHSPMMLNLPLDVSDGFLALRYAHRKSCISFLPREIFRFRNAIVQPFRGAAFQKLNGFGDGDRARHGEQNVHVICNAAYRKGGHSIFTRDAADVGTEAVADIRGDQGRLSVLNTT